MAIKKVCKLTKYQNYLWEKYYSMCINDGMTGYEADKDTKLAMIENFPSLKGCDKFE